LKTFTYFLLVLTFCIPAWAAPHKLRVEDPVLTRALVAQGAKVIGDYGTFSVLSADDALLSNGVSNHVEIADQWNLIRLNARRIDTSAPEVKALRKPRGAFAGKRLHLVQFAGPVKPQWLAELKQNGVEIVSYIPENSYLIYGDAAALARMQAWAGASAVTQWEGEYSGDLKVHSKARALVSRRSDGKFEAAMFAIQLFADTNSNASTLALINQLKTAPIKLDYRSDPYRNLVVSLPSDQLDAIAAQPDVISIQAYVQPKKRDERQDQIVAGNLSGTKPSGPGYLAWLASKGFTQQQFDASGFVVDVADSGIDNGTLNPGHFGLYPGADTGQPSRLVYTRIEGTPNFGGTLAGCDGHGTLNGHIIGNYDDFSGPQHKDSENYSYGVGVCPFVKLGSSVIFDNSIANNDFTSPDFGKMASDAYDSGARISNNSWGSDASGDYNFDAQSYDKLVRDAQSTVDGNQEMVFAFAAGNAGPCNGNKSTQGIDSPGSAKNVITVGASENVRSLSIDNGGNTTNGIDACDESDATASSADDISCSSSRGPCSDGRMKPDLVAPGIHITGGVAQNFPPPSPAGLGSAISCFDSQGVCALPGSGTPGNTNNFFPLGQEFYTESSGTSHSTPVVAGACALVRQYFINHSLNAPSPAMTKAFLMNSARYLTGVSANDTLWSGSQGMGEVNLGVAFDGVQRFVRDQVTADKFTATGQRRAFIGQVTDSSKPFRVTVAWTDAPGSTTASVAANNNLDLTVTIGGNIYKGNVFSGRFSTTGGAADTKNNVESVFLPAGVTGEFSVLVTGANINSDGVPNEAPSIDQDFALVIYNGDATNSAVYSPVAAGYSGLFYESSGVVLGYSGAISVNTTASGSYSGKLQIGAKSFSFSGAFDLFGAATNAIVRKGDSTLALSLKVDLDHPEVITGTVSEPGNWTADLRANQVVSSGSTVSFAGNYTVIIPGTNGDPQIPAGDSFGTANVTTAGKVKFTGSLADGMKLSQSAVIAANGQWPFYASLYSGHGQILGWLTVTKSGVENVGGDVSWIKSGTPTAKIYPAGFNFTTHATGSVYNSAAVPLIDFSNGIVVLTGGNLANAITNFVTVNSAGATGSNSLSLKLSATKGTFKGSIANPPGKSKISFSGVFLQSQDFGSGYFLGTTESGRIFFGPAN
jgi:subtilase family protein